MKLAMKMGETYRLHEIGVYQWAKVAREVGREPEELRAEVQELSAELPDRAADVLERTRSEGLSHLLLSDLTRQIQRRARACAAALDSGVLGDG